MSDNEISAQAAGERRRTGIAAITEIMGGITPNLDTPMVTAAVDFAAGEVWTRPGLDRRSRRWITLACAGASGAPLAVSTHLYGALKSGDITLEEAHEFVLHFAVYAGWPKASVLDQALREISKRIEQEGGPLVPGHKSAAT